MKVWRILKVHHWDCDWVHGPQGSLWDLFWSVTFCTETGKREGMVCTKKKKRTNNRLEFLLIGGRIINSWELTGQVEISWNTLGGKRNLPSSAYTHTHDWLVSLVWLTGWREYALPTQRSQPVLLCGLLALARSGVVTIPTRNLSTTGSTRFFHATQILCFGQKTDSDFFF